MKLLFLVFMYLCVLRIKCSMTGEEGKERKLYSYGLTQKGGFSGMSDIDLKTRSWEPGLNDFIGLMGRRASKRLAGYMNDVFIGLLGRRGANVDATPAKPATPYPEDPFRR